MRQLNSGPLASSEALRKIAVAADQLGFGAVTAHDHVTLGPGEKHHFSDGTAEKLEELESRGVPTSTFYETVSMLSYVAGITERVKPNPPAGCFPGDIQYFSQSKQPPSTSYRASD